MFSIAPSLMCANLLDIESQIRAFERAGAKLFHVDIMDGHFVPNIGLNFDLVRQIKQVSRAQLDVHLMVDDPASYLDQIQALKVDLVSFHIEVSSAPLRMIRSIKTTGAKVGIALNPSTPVQAIQYVLDQVDFVLVMTVEPGFAGQKFIPAMYEKIQTLRTMLDAIRPEVFIEVDGNLGVETSRECIRNGASILVGGTSSVFLPGKDVASAYTEFEHQLCNLYDAENRLSATDGA